MRDGLSIPDEIARRQDRLEKVKAAELPADAPFIEQMKRRLQTRERREAYDLRKSTIEPVFGII